MNYKKKSLLYHNNLKPGKISISVTKPCLSKKDLSLAYTPGVAYPCIEIEKKQSDVYKYTNKGNLVAVISNGTAVLGLGEMNAVSCKPVMEGKAVLFKRFAGVDVFDLEINEKNPKKFVEIVKSLEPSFGGVNLEDIKAPDCFYIEKTLVNSMDIPVFHDDQHGTAIVSSAALINALIIAKKDIRKMKMVVSGAGSAAIAASRMFIELGMKKKNIIMFDSKGVLNKNRKDLNTQKRYFSMNVDNMKLKDAIKGSDIFLGLSVKNILSIEMIKSMAENPIIFALSNPEPEIDYYSAKKSRKDIILATGRSDFPNQINNVLGFPFIFRGALDCNAKKITNNMKMQAAYALSYIARQKTPEYLKEIYNEELFFSKDYFIPKPFDKRIFVFESYAVLEAAVKDKVNRKKVNLMQYRKNLQKMAEKGIL